MYVCMYVRSGGGSGSSSIRAVVVAVVILEIGETRSSSTALKGAAPTK